jgi:hypothetical protein
LQINVFTSVETMRGHTTETPSPVEVEYPARTWHTIAMSKRKRPRDINQLAKFIVDVSTGDAELPECQPDGKNPAAVELGKLGGKKGARLVHRS